ncbi:MAG: radical SAM protein, partial [Treponema sp.]|nr:radical SAM protein [Treponema sp.]
GLFGAKDYPSVAEKSIRWMIENFPMNIIEAEKNGETKEKMLRGVIIRHLFLPGRMDDTVSVLEWLKKNADGRAILSLMSQYTPVPFTGDSDGGLARKKSLEAFQNRLVSAEEDADLRDFIDAYGFDYVFYQDLSDDTSWLPDFNRTQPFSNALAKPLWHWTCGLLPGCQK